MSEITGIQEQRKTGGKGFLAILVILLLAVLGIALYLFFGASMGGFETRGFSKVSRQFVLRPEDFDIPYYIDPSGDSPLTNDEVVLIMGVAEGKAFVTRTGRIDGWETTLLRVNNNDIGPQKYKNSISIYETAGGAADALDPHYLWGYTTPEEVPQDYLTDNCNIGSDCTIYTSEEFYTVSGLTVMRYDVTFRYRNAAVWVSVTGLDIEITEQDAFEAANLILERLQNYEQ
jgi:hypothetical protein